MDSINHLTRGSMTIKVGTDICSIDRIANAYKRFGQRFLKKLFTENEIAYILSAPPHTVARIAGRFAAKEAASKCLGTGWYGLSWKEIEIGRKPSGEPILLLHGRAIDIAKKRGVDNFEVSISHEHHYATATVIASSAGKRSSKSTK
jgi:holo-[acyl-carrier protein] synthase